MLKIGTVGKVKVKVKIVTATPSHLPAVARLVGRGGGVALLLVLILWWLVDELAVTCNILSHVGRGLRVVTNEKRKCKSHTIINH